jgi:hypothetical protein
VSKGTSQNYDGGKAVVRKRKSATKATATVRHPVEKAYSTRLPVSGQEPPRLTKSERERLEAR